MEESAAAVAEESVAEVAVVLVVEESVAAVAAVAVAVTGGCDCCLL